MFAFARLAEAGQPALQPNVLELVAPARYQFVCVELIRRVPNNLVPRAVEDAVQRKREFHHAEIGRQMPAALCDDGYDGVARFLRHLRHLFVCQRLEIVRSVYSFQNRAVHEQSPYGWMSVEFEFSESSRTINGSSFVAFDILHDIAKAAACAGFILLV